MAALIAGIDPRSLVSSTCVCTGWLSISTSGPAYKPAADRSLTLFASLGGRQLGSDETEVETARNTPMYPGCLELAGITSRLASKRPSAGSRYHGTVGSK
jgi:hypothetical protein